MAEDTVNSACMGSQAQYHVIIAKKSPKSACILIGKIII